MDIKTLLSFEWHMMAPEFSILITTIVVSLFDLFSNHKAKKDICGWLSAAGIGIALLFLFTQSASAQVSILYDTYIFDHFAYYSKFVLLLGTLFVLFMAMSKEHNDEMHDRGEYYYLLLTALLGAMMVASGGDLITLFVGLELLSLSSYVLVGFKGKEARSTVSSMKFLINGSIATAFTLFGFSYIYGLTGTTNLVEISREMSSSLGSGEPLAIIGFIITFIGLSFKISSVPFHMWAPDVYVGAPIPVTAFLSVVSKAAGFFMIIRIYFTVFAETPGLTENESLFGSMVGFISLLAILTMLVGNLAALRQQNIKRMLAYSSIGHAGFLLIPLVGWTSVSFEHLWFYLLSYLFMNIGAFAIIQIVTLEEKSEKVTAFAGLYQKNSVIALLMTVFLISLAGIPGTAGFIAKFKIFMTALVHDPSLYVLAGVMAVATIISYVYYFNVLVQMYIRPPHSETTVTIKGPITITIVSCIIGTILLGIVPSLIVNLF
ncbi:NADH-quinone oxidoreductase subunit NuoN [Salirhabdus salicampi]|uniref:NADH-quinone oxidoreductase subunit NuoN n=1 Tax=Salirhabdus salicampi TaxID=476102 RepID=UPI0020C3A0B2|nr:NADH-quinone oxidoreductase subunit NuoN [Salirhabdus salicampi]MCP8617458.1 NADH-quinone oxidoreductase subunit NuoN [Salirhabdus salicampi]